MNVFVGLLKYVDLLPSEAIFSVAILGDVHLL